MIAIEKAMKKIDADINATLLGEKRLEIKAYEIERKIESLGKARSRLRGISQDLINGKKEGHEMVDPKRMKQ